ncbi:MAG: glycosyltransferase family 39 protein [Pirellulales bacterium]
MPPRWLLLLLLCAVLVGRQNYLLSHGDELRLDPDGYRNVASNLYHDQQFARSGGNSNSPFLTAARPPLFPWLLSLSADDDMCGWLHLMLGTLTVWATWHLGRIWKLPPGACLVAAGLVAVDPILLNFSAQPMTETLATFLAALALVALSRAAAVSSLAWPALCGLLFGLCILCRPVFLPWLTGAAVVFPWLGIGEDRWRRLALLLIATAVTLSPWAWRNYRVFGSPVITTTHGGFTLLLANNPSFYEYLRSAPWESTWDGRETNDQWRAAWQFLPTSTPQLAVPDEIANDRWAYREAFKNIRAEPGMFAWSCLARVGRLWNVLPHQTTPDEGTTRRGMRYAVAIWYTFEFLLAAAGAWFLRGKLFAHPWVWGTLMVLSTTAVHAFYWTDMRMRAPLAVVVALAAAHGLAVLACGKPSASALQDAA